MKPNLIFFQQQVYIMLSVASSIATWSFPSSAQTL